jgi:3-oxoacyl-[acyl-carrier protein] reductase
VATLQEAAVQQGRFAGKVAIVTGGSNGLGRAIAAGFAAEGGQVVVADLADAGFFAGNPQVTSITGDIAEAGFAGRVIDTAVTRFGQADILVNDAAAYPDGTLLDMPAPDWERVFAVNVTGTFMLTQAFARHCAGRAAAGAVVSISTGSARNPRPGGAAYSASKAAVETMSKVFAMELGPLGIRVNVVAPGYIDVRGWSEAFPDRAPEDLRAALVRSIPLGRAGDPRDIASAVLFLASQDAEHITGTVLEVDGGSNAGRFSLAGHVAEAASGARG